MSESDKTNPDPVREKVVLHDIPRKSGWNVVVKLVVIVAALAIGLTVLVFGTCVLALSR